MGFDYSEYIVAATRRLVDLFSSDQIRREEKELYISSFTYALSENVFSPEKIERYDVLFAKQSLLYIDNKLCELKSMQPLNQELLNEVVLLCERQNQNIAFLRSEKIVLPNTRITNIDQFCNEIMVNYDNNCFMMRTLQLDTHITEAHNRITSYNDEECKHLFSLLEVMDEHISECKNRGIDCTRIRNSDTAAIRDKIISNRTKLENDSYFAQVVKLDEVISNHLNGLGNNDQDPTNALVPLLEEMELKIAECKKRGINTTHIKNANVDAIRNRLGENAKRIADEQYFGVTSSVDKQISRIVDDINRSDAALLVQAFVLLDELDSRIIECRKRGIKTKNLKNEDTNLTRKRINDYKQEVSDRSKLLAEIISVDSEIVDTCKMWSADPNCLNVIVSLCDKCSALLKICKKRGWDVPKLKCSNPTATKNKYLTYDDISKTDRIIANLVNDVSRDNSKCLIENVTKQRGMILSCSENRWPVPELMVQDLDGAITQYNKALARIQRKSTIKLVLILVSIFSVIFVGSIIGLRYHYLSTHTRMPINQFDSVGNNYLDILAEFEAAGFSNVTAIPVSFGIQQSGVVLGITVNGKDSFGKNNYYSKQAKIVVTYSSEDRINLTPSLVDWNQKSVNYMEYMLKTKGCTVDKKEVKNTALSSNGVVCSLAINGVEYNSGDCYVPEGAKVTVYYYAKMCEIRKSAKDIVGEDYVEIRTELLALGFDNIKLVKKDDLIIGWVNEDRSIYSITINGEDGFKPGELYHHNAEIVITVHTFPNTNYPYIDY